MANTRELRRRIKSVKNTSQITKAMQMVAAAKMRRAQDQATAGRPYSENLAFSLSKLLPKINLESHPLLVGNGAKTTGVVLLSTDRGLVGALNTNLFRSVTTANFSSDTSFYTVGKKARLFSVKLGRDLKADFENPDLVTFRQAKQLSKLLMDSFKSGEVGEVFLVYPHFVSTLKQEPRKVKLLPIDPVILKSPQATEGSLTNVSSNKLRDSSASPQNDGSEFLFEPNPDALLEYLLVHHIEEQIYQALRETKASQYSAQMIAMKNATDNAKELVEDLKLTYNQTRQAAITTELLEITTAQVAMQ